MTAPKIVPTDALPDFIELGVAMPQMRGVRGELTRKLRALLEAPNGASIFLAGQKTTTIGNYVASAGGTGRLASRKVEGGIRVWKIN